VQRNRATRYVSWKCRRWLSYWKQNHDVLGHSVEIRQWKWTQHKWHSRSQYVTGNDAIRQATYNFVLVFHCNYVSMLHRKYSEILWFISRNLRGHVTLIWFTWHIPFAGNLWCAHLIILCVNQYTTFAVPSFIYSKDTIGARIKTRDPDHAHLGVVYHPKANSRASKLKNGSHVTLTTPLLGTLCQPKARTWYSVHVCKI